MNPCDGMRARIDRRTAQRRVIGADEALSPAQALAMTVVAILSVAMFARSLEWKDDATIFAATALLDEVGQPPIVEPEEEAEEIIDEFKDFIESVNPDDFAS